MRPQGLFLLAITIPNIILGFFILLRNVRDWTNIFFAAFAFSVGMWALGLAGFIFSDQKPIALHWAQFYYMAAAIIAVAFLGFSLSFTDKWHKLRYKYFILIFPLACMLLAIAFRPSFLLSDLAYHSWGKEVILNKQGYLLYTLYFVSYVAVGFLVILNSLLKAHGIQKIYLKYVFVGLIIAFSMGALFNLFYPFFGNYRFIWVGPLFTLAYVTVISYAIVRHRLFDIRLIVARSLGYVLSIFALSAVFGLVAFNLVNNLVFQNNTVTNSERLVYTLLAVVIAFAFQPVKRFFDRLTNRFFYHDAYEPQALIDNLNKVLVGNIELDSLLIKSADIISTTVKAEFCTYGIKAVNSRPSRVITNAKRPLEKDSFATIQELIKPFRKKMIVTDELEDGSEKLRTILQTNDIAVVAALVDASHARHETLGYMLVGAKKSGNPFSTQDIRILDIIADELVIAIQNALRFEEIQQFNLTLQQKIDDATHKLRQSNEKLRALDETKDEFISMASHQLRTPLTSVKGYLSMVLEGDAGKISDMQKKLLDQAFISSQRMVYLIADLLNVSRLKTGKFVIEAVPTQLADVIESEIAQLTETAKGRGLELTYQKPKDFPILMLDETKIRQVIMNFADNALYYTPSGTNRGHIRITLEDKANSVEFTVVDDGIGVPKAVQHHLFTKFFRASNAQHARPDGTGLGLFMAKKVIAASGGAIIFHSEEGKGSTFGFSFPKAKLKVPEHLKK